jgi:hypothetical protein
MSAGKSLIVMPTAENNEALRAIRDSDAVDQRIDRTMMEAMLRLTPRNGSGSRRKRLKTLKICFRGSVVSTDE